MLKKTLLVLGVAWTGTAAAASNGLDDVTMNIVNESAFQEIINAQPAEIERLLQVNGNAQPVRTVVLRNMDGELLNATPVNSQVLTVNKELNQGMVSFSFICAEGQDCQQRVQNLNTSSGFILNAPVGSGINVLPNGIEIAPLPPSTGTFEIIEAPAGGPVSVPGFEGTLAPIAIKELEAGSLLPLQVGNFEGVTVGVGAPIDINAFNAENVQPIEGALLDNVVFTPATGL